MTIRDILQTEKSAGAGIAKLLADQPATKPRVRMFGAAESVDRSVELPASVLAVGEIIPESVRADEITLTLPWGPSMNRYWRRHGHTIYVSSEGKKFAERVKAEVAKQYRGQKVTYRVAIMLELWAPLHGRYDDDGWDTDNWLKPTKDALTKAGFWVDDKQVRSDFIVDRGRCDGGKMVVHVRPFVGLREGCE